MFNDNSGIRSTGCRRIRVGLLVDSSWEGKETMRQVEVSGRKAGEAGKEVGGQWRCLIIRSNQPPRGLSHQEPRSAAPKAPMKVPGKWNLERVTLSPSSIQKQDCKERLWLFLGVHVRRMLVFFSTLSYTTPLQNMHALLFN